MASPQLQLYSLFLSPWSERARWVLEHHGLPYRKIEHIPFLGERRLRRVLGNPAGRVTVPVLIADGQVLKDSWEIALYADRVGHGAPLIADAQAVVRRWHDRVEQALSAGRSLTIARTLADDRALDETVAAPRLLRPLVRPIGRQMLRWFARKYALELDPARAAAAAQPAREVLDQLRRELGGGDYLLGRFSYADIIAASLLQGVSPVSDRFLRIGPATRRAWTQRELANTYSDLIAWRDRLYERHRRRPAAAAGAAA
ncbi:MAG TPA: glutathione S-transferase [Polyangiaceae bacterium]|jgi:glutathione S-transferase|nr:glutathione S-transferase [Polyangiaceae bacterium]